MPFPKTIGGLHTFSNGKCLITQKAHEARASYLKFKRASKIIVN